MLTEGFDWGIYREKEAGGLRKIMVKRVLKTSSNHTKEKFLHFAAIIDLFLCCHIVFMILILLSTLFSWYLDISEYENIVTFPFLLNI